MSVVNFSSRLLSAHKSYLHHFTNRKIQALGSFIGGWCGFTYLLEYYSTVEANNAISAWNAVANKSEANKKKVKSNDNSNFQQSNDWFENDWFEIVFDKNANGKDTCVYDMFDFVKEMRETVDESKTKYNRTLEKYPNPFSIVVSQQAPFSFNLLTSVVSGSVCGYLFATYYPFCLGALIIHNSLNYSKTDNTKTK